MMAPVSATTKPAPADTFTWRTVTVKPRGAPSLAASSREGVLRLGHAHGHAAEAERLELRELLLGRRARTSRRRHGRCASRWPRSSRRATGRRRRRTRTSRRCGPRRRPRRTGAPPRSPAPGRPRRPSPTPRTAPRSRPARGTWPPTRSSSAFVSVGNAVDGHHARQVVHLRDVLHVLQQVRQARFQRLEVLLVEVGLRHAAVVS